MNKERIFLNIKELQKKINDLDQRLSDPSEPVSALDLDTQLMYLRLMYDSYLSLRPDVRTDEKKRGKSKKEQPQKEKEPEQEPEQEQSEERETSLPLLFAEEEAAPEKKAPAPAQEKKEDKPKEITEEKPVETPEKKAGEKAEKVEKPEEKPEEKTEEKIEEKAEVKAEEKPEEKTEEPAGEPEGDGAELPEVDFTMLEEESGTADFDLNSIEFEDEPDGDDADEEPAPKKRDEDPYEPYYPGLNPKAMDGEPETGYPTYSGKQGHTLGEHFAQQFPSLNDQLSLRKGEDRSLAGRKQRDQISDLTKSIDLNLKFTFVRELFNGNAKLLSEELNNLNMCGRLESALSLFEEMKGKYRWKEENEAVQQLYELVLRKFAR